MKYMGSKNRIAKEILWIILKDREKDQLYIEPFVGGCNTFDKVKEPKIGYDINSYLIEMWKAVSNGWMPDNNYTEDDYRYIKNNKDINPKVTGYSGFALSYAGKWFGGWCRDSEGKRDYVNEAYKNAAKQFPLLKNAWFECVRYQDIITPYESIIYCDPPYARSTKYKDDFDHNEFWQWCRDKTKEGHQVFISEYEAPEDFKCIWEKEIVSSLTKNTGSKRGIERLFTYQID